MRYVNLKKRNTSKFQFVAKRVASVSLLSLLFTAVVVIPLTTNDEFNTLTKPETVNIDDGHIGDDNLEMLDNKTFEQE